MDESQTYVDGGSIRASLLCLGDPPSELILDALRQQSIRVGLLERAFIARDRNKLAPVVLLWLAASGKVEFVKDVMKALTDTEGNIPAVIGHAPTGSTEDSIAAFEAGVVSFVVGRCSGRELACRIRALHRREASRPKPTMLYFDDITLDPANFVAHVQERVIPLTNTELALLRALVAAKGTTLSRAQLIRGAWAQTEGEVGLRTVDNVVLRLRRKLGDGARIETVRGIGFRLGSSRVDSLQNLSA